MIKKIIFDLDNTLIDWKDEYIFAFTNVIKKLNLNYDEDKIKEIDSAIVTYEECNNIYTKEKFLQFLNQKCKKRFKI